MAGAHTINIDGKETAWATKVERWLQLKGGEAVTSAAGCAALAAKKCDLLSLLQEF